MSTEKPSNKNSNPSLKAINAAFNLELPDQLKKQMKKSLDGFRQDLKEHPHVRKLERREISKKLLVLPNFRNLYRPLLLVAAGLFGVATLAFFFIGNNPPTWAEVSDRLDSVTNLTAVIFGKSHAFSQPHQIEFWVGYGDRVRLRSGSKVTFAKNDFVKTFDLETRSECYPESASGTMCFHSDAFYILRLLKIKGTTIEAVITQGMSRSTLVDTTFQISANPEISKDLVVFDAESEHGIWRRRIWALRESKLPIRLSEWSPMGGRYETLISYSKE